MSLCGAIFGGKSGEGGLTVPTAMAEASAKMRRGAVLQHMGRIEREVQVGGLSTMKGKLIFKTWQPIYWAAIAKCMSFAYNSEQRQGNAMQ